MAKSNIINWFNIMYLRWHIYVTKVKINKLVESHMLCTITFKEYTTSYNELIDHLDELRNQIKILKSTNNVK